MEVVRGRRSNLESAAAASPPLPPPPVLRHPLPFFICTILQLLLLLPSLLGVDVGGRR